MNNKDIRSNCIIFKELEDLSSTPGYIHILTYFDFFSNSIFYEESKGLNGSDISAFENKELPIRFELSLLIGLLCKHGIFDRTHLTLDEFRFLSEKTLDLLKELHSSQVSFDPKKLKKGDASFLEVFDGGLKENILYGGESFYDFQYTDFAPLKYKNDNDWFVQNKGFSLEELMNVINALGKNYEDNVNLIYEKISKYKNVDEGVLAIFNDLSSHILNLEVISTNSDVNYNIVKNVLNAFSYDFSTFNSTFTSDADFNMVNAYPIFRVDDNYILLIRTSLYEALYETPFFWFLKDKKYRNKASENRGEFTEQFSKECLEKVFGNDNVYLNVNIMDYKKVKGKELVGEIDVLVTFGNKAIILQAKSKKLTIESRKGNLLSVNKDFKNAIQDSYNQGYSCSELILNKKLKLIMEDEKELKINRNFDEIFIFCVLSDHYPSLSLQVKELLKYETTDIIQEPFVMDVFLLDVMTEMLSTPLYFLDYIKKRALSFNTMIAQNELIILGYHLSMNLNPQQEFTAITLTDDIASCLDASMIVRRKGHEGVSTPSGILTKFKDTFIGDYIDSISRKEDIETIKMGLLFLSLSEDTMKQINEKVDYIIMRNAQDLKSHSITLCFTSGISAGIIFYTNHIDFIYAKRNFRKSFEVMIMKQDLDDNYALYIDSNNRRVIDIKTHKKGLFS
ncbi:MAG: prepilin peptidase [Campylobacteraceae bacterium]|nr:hypothetical protein [Cetobacterium sp.]NQY24404.1 prepilin peptidase [Campylobacteraceae bacterium]